MSKDSNLAADLDILHDCETAIGYTFSQQALLRAALTHTSSAQTRLASNERLELLGDAILGFIICEHLFHRFPEHSEGDLTKIKSAVVSRRTCARISRLLGLGDFLFLGKGMNQQQAIPANLLADVYESLVGAIYLDGGIEPAKSFVLKYMSTEIDEVAGGAHAGNYKSHLQQYAQKEMNETPIYQLLDEKGPDHSKCFKIAAMIGRYSYPAAWGKTKKEAEQKAAMNALASIHGDVIPFQTD